MSYTLVGLGNPGEEYRTTRHNAGRMVVDAVAHAIAAEPFKENIPSKALVATGKIGKEKIVIVEPNNFMNRSGPCVAAFLKKVLSKKKPAFPKLIVVHDDLDMPLGKIKIAYNRSSGGHRGVESIIKALKTQEFVRVKIGISAETPSGKLKKPKGEDAVGDYIVGPFKKSELDILKKVIHDAVEAIKLIITDSREKAMGEFN